MRKLVSDGCHSDASFEWAYDPPEVHQSRTRPGHHIVSWQGSEEWAWRSLPTHEDEFLCSYPKVSLVERHQSDAAHR